MPELRPSTRRLLTAALLALAAVLLFVRLGDAPVTRSSEQRCLDTAADMVEGGSWIVPHMNGKPRLQKPPLYYWAAASVGQLSGGLDRTSGRVPSVLAGLLLLLVVVAWGRSVGGFTAGLGAGVLLLSMAMFVTLARRGDAEMLLAATVAAALCVYDRIRYGGRHSLLPLFAGLLTLGFLAKATVALMCVGLPIVIDLALARRHRDALRPRVLGWVAAGIGLGAMWYVAVILVMPDGLAVIREQLLLPILGGAAEAGPNHVRPVWYFVSKIVAASGPAVLLLPVAIALAWRTRVFRDEPRLRFVAIVAISLLVAFSAIPQKQKHYILPVLAPLAILLSVAVCRLPQVPRERWTRAIAITTAAGGAVALVVIGAYVLPFPLWLWAPLAAIVGWRAVWLARRDRVHLRQAVVTYAIGAVVLLGAYHWGLVPLKATLKTEGLAGIAAVDRPGLQRRLENSRVLRALLQFEPPTIAMGTR